MNCSYKRNKGFTLIELIVVVAIISTLSAMAFMSFSKEAGNARDEARLTDLQTFDTAFSTANAQGVTINLENAATTGSGSGTTDTDRITTTSGSIRVLRNGKLLEVKEGLVDSSILAQIGSDPRSRAPYLAAFINSSLYQLFASSENPNTGIATAVIKGTYKKNIVVDNVLSDVSNSLTLLPLGNAGQFIPGTVDTGVTPNTTTGDVIQIDNEKMAITAIDRTNNTITVTRGFNTTAEIHSKRKSIKLIQFALNAESLLCIGNLLQVSGAATGGDTSDDAYTCSANKSILSGSQVLPYLIQ
jgi:prepilin-type N-terminal cleavage/methylation domain-containing protein